MEQNLANLHEAVAQVAPDRECIIFRERRLTYSQVTDRTRRLANHLLAAGLGCHTERDQLAGHESGQDHIGLYLHNGNEYVEGMLGAFKARLAPFNVNYRYVAEELRYLLTDANAKALIYHSAFAPTLAEVRDDLPNLEVLLQVPDESGNDLLPGAMWYEDALAMASPSKPQVELSPDDLYILYTGGTTGMPKGVLWRQADIWAAAMGGRELGGDEFQSLDVVLEAAANGGLKYLPTAPLMHGASQWVAFNAFSGGHTIILQSVPERLDPADVWSLASNEGANVMLIVGDAFARPLIDELDRNDYNTGSLLIIASGGAVLNAGLKDQIIEHIPQVTVLDAVGSSETGSQMSHASSAGEGASSGKFTPGVGACVVSEDLSRRLSPGDDEQGWLAQEGRVPLGYLGDAEKTARTFPVIDGTRYSVPGDRSSLDADGTINLFGRDSVTINSGGEKIFAEEVEQALTYHPDIYDVTVCGRPSERWGNEVVAVVQLRDGCTPDEASMLAECEKHIARYKMPKAFVYVDQMVRSPAGKADYRWARSVAESA